MQLNLSLRKGHMMSSDNLSMDGILFIFCESISFSGSHYLVYDTTPIKLNNQSFDRLILTTERSN